MSERQRQSNENEGPSRIPEFQSLEEEAEFWDTHDFTDYLDELQSVRVRFSPNLSTGMTVRLDPADREALGPSTLVRMWIKEQLRGETI
jgi:hypothetical protein